MNLPKKTEAKLIEDMIAAYESRREEHRGGPESAMRIVLYVAEKAIRDAVLEEAALKAEPPNPQRRPSKMGIWGAAKVDSAKRIRAMKTEGGE